MAWSNKAKQGESGFADDYIITIRSSRITTPEKFDSPVWVIKGEQELPDGSLNDDGSMILSLGDFEPGDAEGSFAIHTTQDRDKHFNSKTKGMKFIKSALAAGVPIEDRTRTIDGWALEDRDLAAWEGLRVRVHEESYETKNFKTGEPTTGRQPLVTEFLGTAEAPVAAAAGSAAAPASNGASNGALTAEKATELAKASSNALEYIEAAVKAGATFGDQYANEGFFAQAKG